LVAVVYLHLTLLSTGIYFILKFISSQIYSTESMSNYDATIINYDTIVLSSLYSWHTFQKLAP